MDLLYTKYANPMDFIHLYIKQGRFGEFVSNILEIDYKRKQEEAEKENDRELWEFYLHKVYDKSFKDFKESLRNSNSEVLGMTDKEVEETKQHVSDILKRFAPV